MKTSYNLCQTVSLGLSFAITTIAVISSSTVKSNAFPYQQALSYLCPGNERYVVFAQRPIAYGWMYWRYGGDPPERGTDADHRNNEVAHEHIFFCENGQVVNNVGYGDLRGGSFFSYTGDEITSGMEIDRNGNAARLDNFRPIDSERYNTEVIDYVIQNVTANQAQTNTCTLADGEYNLLGNNCQDFTARVRQEYWRNMFMGTWIAEGYQCPFGTYHREVISMQISENSLVATKIDSGGDQCVPTGSRTFSGSIPNNVSKGSSFPITYVVGNPDNPASGNAPGQLMIVDANTLYSGSSTGEGITFRRAEGR